MGVKKNPDPVRHPSWQRLDNEGRTPHKYFKNYLRQDRPRNIRRLAEDVGICYDVMRHYSSKFNWAARAKAWDEDLDRAEADTIIEEASKMAKEHMKAMKAARALGTIAIARILQVAEDTDDPPVTARDALALIREAVHLERLIIGEATERSESTVKKELDTSMLSGEEVEELLSLLDKAGALDD